MWGIYTMCTLLYLQEPQLLKSKPKETFGGYNCEFVEPPQSAFQTECPICHLILREPYLVSCCGTHYCHTCIQRLQADNSPCPTCREDNFEVFPNKGLNRALKQLQVYCIPRPYLAIGQGGQLPPQRNWLQSIIKYYLFIAASY